VTTLETELIPDELPSVQLPPNASVTGLPAFPDAPEIIARVRAGAAEHDLMIRGYLEMASELSEWAEMSFVAQTETIPAE
jgi:hypothetical protein